MYGIFKNTDSADRALAKFAALDYDPKEISIITEQSNNAAKGAGTGAVTGGLAGGVAGLLLGIGAVTITGFSPLLIAGPFALLLGIPAAAAATVEGVAAGAVGGGLIGVMVGLGIPESTAQVYQNSIKEGKILIGVPVRSGADSDIVRKVFTDENAEEIYLLNK